jgi:transcriptional regulator with GAF, ATPase, and Fis domain
VSPDTRESRLLQTFAKLADTLVAHYDVVDMLQLLVDTCNDVFDTGAAGILLVGDTGELEVIASTSEASRIVETLQLAAEAGPCIESFRTGKVVSVPDIASSPAAWSAFSDGALGEGFRAAVAVPMRLRETNIGSLNLLMTTPGGLDESDLVAAQALADVATIGILHEQSMRQGASLTHQLQTALNRRVVIEQAKGVVSQSNSVGMDEAFQLIRGYARAHQVSVSSVAERLVNMTLSLDDEDTPTP